MHECGKRVEAVENGGRHYSNPVIALAKAGHSGDLGT